MGLFLGAYTKYISVVCTDVFYGFVKIRRCAYEEAKRAGYH